MSCSNRLRFAVGWVVVVALLTGVEAFAQALPNPYRAVDGWAKLPEGRQMGAVGGVDVDPDGEHIWAVIRCDATEPERFGNECLDSDLDPVLKFDPDGNVVESFGSGMFIWPHGIDVDPDGNVWVTDAVSATRTPEGNRGHQVIKFNPGGEVLMRLGTPGVPGSGPDHFNAPSGVVVADNGDIFVARVRDPHGNVIYESSADPHSGTPVQHDLDESFGGMVLELGVRAEAIDQLVSGGVPQSRMPYIVALLVLTSGLLVTAVWQLRREAELADLREDFVSSVSHQLRTPLTQIRMFGETLMLGRVRNEAERSRATEIIVDEANRLTHQVENVLLFSRGERGALHLNPVEADLGALVESVSESFEPLALAADVTLERRIESGIVCVTDVEATRQAVLNLLDNAVKYGPTGQVIEIGVRRTPGAQNSSATVWVEDEGPGIPPGQQDRVWDAYVRLDRDRASATAGSGIGLAVAREVIEAQGGRVRVEAGGRTPNPGARFVIELPLASGLREA